MKFSRKNNKDEKELKDYSKIKVLVKCRPLNFKEEAFNLKNNNDIIEISKN